ncbi:MAG: hypothetical protein HN919_01120 [Verrucomicrobia bacterium]|jgi:signal transduction histidine kinase|nr:hypothetical protein [Verrucomicrobiota bacterium]MBT7702308.1 hypothetical protein [Verrucomicrobiota bacterium]
MTEKNRMDLSSRGARTHFAIAIALISVIPCLTLFYLLTTAAGSRPFAGVQWAVALCGVVGSMIFGYALLVKYPATIIRLRSYLCNVIAGSFPDEIVLSAKEDDITVIEKALNRVLEMLSQKLQDVEAEKILLQEELFQSQKLEAIGTLAGGVAHEINNPINGIMNYAQLILDELGPDSPVSEYATEIGTETERVAQIVRNLLAFARQEKQSLSPERMCDIVNSTLSLVRSVMQNDQIEMEVHVPVDLPLVSCRSQQIQQVIMNLVTNARSALDTADH